MLFTCISCHVAFKDAKSQRDHYKTDWHRYNLKRKVADLPPVSYDNFEERVLAQRAQVAANEAPSGRNCRFCRKSFASFNAFENHEKSKKHLDAVRSYKPVTTTTTTTEKAVGSEKEGTSGSILPAESSGIETRMEGIDSDDDWSDVDEADDDGTLYGDPLAIDECLFCSHHSGNLGENIRHMTDAHSFFIPDADYLIDLEGLAEYLAEKVGVGHMCLWCNDRGKSFDSASSVQRHMLDKGHCKMLHEGEALVEYADYYDYSKSYPEGGDGGKDEEVDIGVLDDGGYELVLPSGVTIGHRSLLRYYRQSLPPERSKQGSGTLRAVVSHYKALGWTGTVGDAAIRKARDVHFVNVRRSKYQLRQGVRNNKLQRHFRAQILM